MYLVHSQFAYLRKKKTYWRLIQILCSVFVFQFNFVGRVIGPRGMTLREVESTTGCKLLVRGKGSMKDKKLVSFNKAKLNLSLNKFVKPLLGSTINRCRL